MAKILGSGVLVMVEGYDDIIVEVVEWKGWAVVCNTTFLLSPQIGSCASFAIG
jgi:hypothetical protein